MSKCVHIVTGRSRTAWGKWMYDKRNVMLIEEKDIGKVINNYLGTKSSRTIKASDVGGHYEVYYNKVSNDFKPMNGARICTCFVGTDPKWHSLSRNWTDVKYHVPEQVTLGEQQ